MVEHPLDSNSNIVEASPYLKPNIVESFIDVKSMLRFLLIRNQILIIKRTLLSTLFLNLFIMKLIQGNTFYILTNLRYKIRG